MRRLILAAMCIVFLSLAKEARLFGQEVDYDGPRGLTVEQKTSQEEYDQKLGVEPKDQSKADEGIEAEAQPASGNAKEQTALAGRGSKKPQAETKIGTVKTTTTQFEKPNLVNLDSAPASKKKSSFSDLAKKKKPLSSATPASTSK